jgi:hypothetical protein
MAGDVPAKADMAAGSVDWGVALLMAAFITAKSSTGATV